MDNPRWLEQCNAARTIQERFGTEKALGYLIGEKLSGFLESSDRDPSLRAELPSFIAEIKAIFEPSEIGGYLSHARRLGSFGHITTAEEFQIFRSAGAVEEDVVTVAEDAILIGRMQSLLLGTPSSNPL